MRQAPDDPGAAACGRGVILLRGDRKGDRRQRGGCLVDGSLPAGSLVNASSPGDREPAAKRGRIGDVDQSLAGHLPAAQDERHHALELGNPLLGDEGRQAVRAIESARAAEPGLAEDDLLTMVGGNTGVSVRLLRIAIRYGASYPAEIDAEIATADRAEELAEQAWQREQRLLAG
jgi:hypothetical protein